MRYANLTTSVLTGLLLFVPASSWAIPVAERPAVSNLRNMANEQLTNADRPERVRVRQGAERAEQLVSSILNRLTTTRARITATSSLDADVQANILADIDAETVLFSAQQTALQAAETPEAIRLIVAAIRQHSVDHQAQIRARQQEIEGRLQHRISEVQNFGSTVLERLRAAMTALQNAGADTTTLADLIETHAASIAQLSHLVVSTDVSAITTAIDTLQSQLHTIVDTIKNLITSITQ